MEFVLGGCSCFCIEITYSNLNFCGGWTPSFFQFTWKCPNFRKTITPRSLCRSKMPSLWSNLRLWKDPKPCFPSWLLSLAFTESKNLTRFCQNSALAFDDKVQQNSHFYVYNSHLLIVRTQGNNLGSVFDQIQGKFMADSHFWKQLNHVHLFHFGGSKCLGRLPTIQCQTLLLYELAEQEILKLNMTAVFVANCWYGVRVWEKSFFCCCCSIIRWTALNLVRTFCW